jgi:acyl-coenzyme A thioesterase PaaI-like protein
LSEQPVSIEKLQELISRGPFNRWLNFTVLKSGPDGIEVKATWREEWVVNPERRYTHGGILAAIVDTVADYAIAAQSRPHGQPVLDGRSLRLRQGRRAGGKRAGNVLYGSTERIMRDVMKRDVILRDRRVDSRLTNHDSRTWRKCRIAP